MSYYEIIPVASRRHGIFDTVTHVADVAGKKNYEITELMGFANISDLIVYCNQNRYPYFNKSAFVARRLNEVCRELNIPIRIVRSIVDIERGKRNEYRYY